MIFQSLISLYERLAITNDVPRYGFSFEDIGFEITIDKSGNLIGDPQDLRVQVKPNVFDFYLSEVPYSNAVNVRSISAATTPNFMVDKADYIFGMSGSEQKKEHQHSFFKLIIDVSGNSNDEGVVAVKGFFSKWKNDNSPRLKYWDEISGAHGKWVAFKLQGDSIFIHERIEVKQLWSKYLAQTQHSKGISLLDGQINELQKQYAQFKFGTGAALVSFNESAYESYRKVKGENAPISVDGEFKSSTALKYLLRSKEQRIKIGDTTTIFWAENKSPIETFMGQILDSSVQNEAALLPLQKFLEALREGKLPTDITQDKEIKFYILGLSLNKARLALRFWYVCTVEELIKRLQDHFECLQMVHSDKSTSFPGVWLLLKETVRDSKDISPVLAGSLMRSILTGIKYPQSLYSSVLGRIRADQAKKDDKTGKPVIHINYLRAAILKAVLQRNHKMEFHIMSLDTERREVGYLLGRLFAILEKAQLDALGSINSTIKDRFYSSASATPASVFPRLLRLSQHHIEKATYGYISDRRIGEIMEHITAFPDHMNLNQQGLFAIAYYQQKNSFYKSNENKITENNND